MGLLAARQKRREDAESLFRKSLDMREQWYGSCHPLVAEIYDALASLSCSDAAESPNVATTEEMFRRALHMREDLLGQSHLLVANTLFKLGRCEVIDVFDTWTSKMIYWSGLPSRQRKY